MSSRPKRKRAWRAKLKARRVLIYDADSMEIWVGGQRLTGRLGYVSGRYVPKDPVLDAKAATETELRGPYDRPSRPVRTDHPALQHLGRAKACESMTIRPEPRTHLDRVGEDLFDISRHPQLPEKT